MSEAGPIPELGNRVLADLMVRAQAGDRQAYDRLLRNCEPLIRQIARRVGVPHPSLDDAVQETLITLHRARQTFDPNRSFEAWLTAIAQRRAIDLLRRLGRVSRREVHAPAVVDEHGDEAQDALSKLEASDEAARLGAAVRTLTPTQQEAINRLALDEQDLTKASAESGRSAVALRVNLHRAIKALRNRLLSDGETEGNEDIEARRKNRNG